ncbi:hypothetical protein, partial [Sulfoacidibacillus thermotolerans]
MNKLDHFVDTLPGRTVVLKYVTTFANYHGFEFMVEIAEHDPVEREFAIKPVNNGPIVITDYREILLSQNEDVLV